MTATPLVFRTMHDRWLSNSWLVADRPGGHAVVIDTGGPFEPIRARIADWRLTVTHVLLTHHHHDHVHHNADYREHFACPCCGHGAERDLFGDLDTELTDGEEIHSGDLTIRALHIPGHTVGQLAFLVNEREVYTGDTLFRGSVGGTRAPGHGTLEQLRHSICDVLLALPPATVVRPGHMAETTIAHELEHNPFVRHWRGLDAPLAKRVTAFGQPAELLVRARDYDGGGKCLVRFDDGRHDTIPASRVTS